MRESIRARHDYLNFAPHLVKPLPCLMPTFGYGKKGKPMVTLGLLANDLIGCDRNRGLPQLSAIRRSRTISKNALFRLIPNLDHLGSNGAALWYDGLALDTERLALKFIIEAVDHGASVANYMRAESLIISDHQVLGATVTDGISGKPNKIRSKMVVNATGPWVENLLTASKIQKSTHLMWAKGINIIFKKPISQTHAIGLEGHRPYTDADALLNRGARLFFFVPWHGYTMAGTTYAPYSGNPDEFKVEIGDILELIGEINAIYPSIRLSLSDITNYHGGLVSVDDMGVPGQDNIQLEKHTNVIDHEKTHQIKGLLTIKSVKYTTAWQTAQKVKKKLMRDLASSGRFFKKKSFETLTPDRFSRSTAAPVGINRTAMGNDRNQSSCKWPDANDFNPKGENKRAFSQEQLLSSERVHFFIQEEMAYHLSDVIFRRSGLGSAECPNMDLLQKVAVTMGKELGWNRTEQEKEITKILDHYALIHHR